MTATHPMVRSKPSLYLSKSILIVVALIALLSVFYEGFLRLKNQTNQQILMNQQINRIIKRQAQLEQIIHSDNERLAAALEEHRYQTDDWLLLKIRYYLELAAINQQFGDNTAMSSALLQKAQLLLTNQHDARFYPIMQAIADDKAALELAPSIDKAALLAQLNAAYWMVQQLKIKIPSLSNSVSSSPNNQPNKNHWQQWLDQSLAQLKQLVIIRHHHDTIQPLIALTDEAIIRDNIYLTLQQAQWAVLQSSQPVYDKALIQAIHDIEQISDRTNHQTTVLIQQLTQLQSIEFNKKQPVSQKSIALINELIQTNQPSNAKKATQ